MAKSRQLLKCARQRTVFLQKMGEKHSHILKEIRKKISINTTDDSELNFNTLIEAIDAEIELSETMFLDWI